MLNSGNVRVGVTGEVNVGPTSTTPPTGTTGPVPTGMKGLGYVDDKGVTEDPNKSTKVIKAWQKGATVRTLVTDGTLTYKFRLIETTAETTALFWGTTVTQTATEGSFVNDPTATGGRKCFLIDVLDGGNLRRIWIPQGEVTDTTALTYNNGDEYGYEVTVTAYYDNALGGNAKTFDTALKNAA
ncbi:hypothetical protein G9U51_08280 [Calidifontibacter sp. DB0510]|uniref:Phage tail protein n=1 Tax=Metallococcus carri TaxID=1656884 RepID=A0A967E8Y8_9MICO|nr:hypothetical protein [Metallococcus carri]NHN55772.1 hypothetical protein [Metallococcus carri]NOP38539.1 hypothetical protein [Calidifontibacter sp. DB2511S]